MKLNCYCSWNDFFHTLWKLHTANYTLFNTAMVELVSAFFCICKKQVSPDLPTQEDGNECDFCYGMGEGAKRPSGGSVRGVPPHGVELNS